MSENEHPNPVLISRVVPVNNIVPNYTLIFRPALDRVVAPSIVNKVTDWDENDPVDYLLKNLDFDTNTYFLNYKTINDKFYSGFDSYPEFKPTKQEPPVNVLSEFSELQTTSTHPQPTLSPRALIEEAKAALRTGQTTRPPLSTCLK